MESLPAWSLNESRPESSNRITNQNLQFSLFETQMEMTRLKQKVKDHMTEKHVKLKDEIEQVNHDLEDLRVGHYDLLNLSDDISNEFMSLQAYQVTVAAEVVSMKKKMAQVMRLVAGLTVLGVRVASYMLFY